MYALYRQAGMQAATQRRTGGGLNAEVATWLEKVETTDGQALETSVVDAVDALVTAIKATGTWGQFAGFGVTAGPRTYQSAFHALIGSDLVAATGPHTFSSSDFERATGLRGKNQTASVLTQGFIPPTSWRDSHHLVAYEVEVIGAQSGRSVLAHHRANRNGAIHMSSAAGNAAFRSCDGSISNVSQSTMTGVIQINRSSSTSFTAFVDSAGAEETFSTTTTADPVQTIRVTLFGADPTDSAHNTLNAAAVWGYSTGIADAADRAAIRNAIRSYVTTLAGIFA